MQLKRMSAGLMACLMVGAIAACGDDSSSSGGASGTATDKPAEVKKVKVAFVLPALNNDYYWNLIKTGAEAEAAKLGAEVELSVSAASDPSANDQIIAKVQDAEAKSPDALAVVVNDGNALAQTLTTVVKAGTPVIAINADVPDSVGKTTFIGTDELAGGKAGGEAMKGALPDGGKIGILHCFPGNPTSDARVKGFKDAIAGSKLTVVATLDARCDAAKTPAVMNDMLTAHPDLDGVFSISDDQTVPAQKVIADAGKDIKIVGYDAAPGALPLIAAGKVYASVAQFPDKMGSEGVKAAVAAARGETVQARIDTGTMAVTKDNVADFEQSRNG